MYLKLTKVLGVFSLLLLLSFVLSACGGGGAGGTGGGTTGDTVFLFNNGESRAVTEDEREAAADAVRAVWQANLALSADQQAAAIGEALKAQTIYRAAGITSGNPWAEYKDGVMHVYHVSDPDVQSPAKLPVQVLSAGQSSALGFSDSQGRGPSSRGVGGGLPLSRKAYIVDAMEPLRPTPFPTITPQLVEAGYDVTLLDGVVADWDKIQDCSLLLVHAHGTVSFYENGTRCSTISTSEVSTRQLNTKYLDRLQSKEMTICESQVKTETGVDIVDVYGVTNKYKYPAGMFADNSYMLAMCCEIGSTPDFYEAFKSRGLDYFSGWTGDVASLDSKATCEFFIDRCFGLYRVRERATGDPAAMTFDQALKALSTTLRGDAGQNPFNTPDYPLDVSYEFFKGNVPPNPPRIQLITYGTSDLISLAPIVNDVQLDSSLTKLILKGHFGPDRGNVVHNGDFLTVRSWTETQITVDRPAEDSGTVRVQNIGAAGAGYLNSNSYKWAATKLKLTPSSAQLARQESKEFTVAAETGSIPTNAQFRWTVTGQGTVNGGAQATTSAPMVTYVAPNADGDFSLQCELLAENGDVLASASVPIFVGQLAGIKFSLTNSSDGRFPNGNYAFSDGEGAVSVQGGFDRRSLDFNLDDEGRPRVSVNLTSAANQPLVSGQTFTWDGISGGSAEGTFNFSIADSLTGPNTSEILYEIGSGGTLQIVSVTDLQDGSQFVRFSFTSQSAGTPKASGTGGCVVTRF